MSTIEFAEAAWRKWLETLVLVVLGLTLFAWAGVEATARGVGVGWLVLVPVLAGAQHGTFCGVVAAALLCGAGLWFVAEPVLAWGALGAAAKDGWWALYCCAGAVTGLFRDMQQRHYAQVAMHGRMDAVRLSELQRAFCCLQWSHAQLEQAIRTQPQSLAAALDAAKARMAALMSLEALALLMLELIASRSGVQSASLYELSPGNRVPPLALASLGGAATDVARHPLVVRALQSGGLVSIPDIRERAQAEPGVVVAVVLQSSCSRLRLLLAVRQLAFDGFALEQLRNLHVLAVRLVDMAQQRLQVLAWEGRDGVGEASSVVTVARDTWDAGDKLLRSGRRSAPTKGAP